MEIPSKSYPSLPSNYVTIVDLQNRWLQQKQQQVGDDQQTNEEKDQATLNLTNKHTNHCDDVKLKRHSQSHRHNHSKFRPNPNFKPHNVGFQGEKLVKEFQRSISSPQSSQFNVATAKEESNEKFSISNNEDEYEKNSQCRVRSGKLFGIKPVMEFRAVEKPNNSTPESSQINFATSTKVESNHVLSNNEHEEDKRKGFQFKPVKEFRKATIASNSTPETSEIDVAAAKVQSKHIIRSNANEFAKNLQFQNRSGSFLRKKHVKVFQVVEKASDSTPESSQINVATTKVEQNQIINNKEDEDDEKAKKNSRFRKNSNLKNRKKNIRNSEGGMRLKELESNAAVKTVENVDQKVEDDDYVKRKKNKNKKKYGKTIVDDRTVEKKGKDDEREDQTAETEHQLKEVNSGEKNEGSTAVIEEGDDQTAETEHKLKEVNLGEKNEGSTAVIEKEYDDQTVEIEHKLKEMNVGGKDERSMSLIEDGGEDQTVEVDGMMKEVNESSNRRSTAVIEEGRRQYGGYHRCNRRNYNYRSTRNHDYNNRSTVSIGRQRGVNWGYNGAHHKGSFSRRYMGDHNWGRPRLRSTAVIEGWGEVHRGYNGRELKWVKIEKENEKVNEEES